MSELSCPGLHTPICQNISNIISILLPMCENFPQKIEEQKRQHCSLNPFYHSQVFNLSTQFFSDPQPIRKKL